MIELGDVHAYEVPDEKGVILYVGIPAGRVRPALWIQQHGKQRILASFHSSTDAEVTIAMLDGIMGAVQRAVDFHTKGKTDGQSA